MGVVEVYQAVIWVWGFKGLWHAGGCALVLPQDAVEWLTGRMGGSKGRDGLRQVVEQGCLRKQHRG